MKQKVMFLIMRKPLKGFRNVVHLLPSAETARAKKKALGMTGSRRVEQDCKAAAKEVLTIVRGIQSGTFSL
ncbi:hypothetical protein IGI04_008931 [Brassica rapa subsp. trilocularis]|uniref:Uncharacterized protein n=1 Tax=Brassica rapa subsp. trilocularis TaxID=1813537 RepID=A0ABQ7MVT9_BRACM|nr:hypothetical protein IGI04_008931 [Brassica rapa subsp. trilocularis]